MKRLQALPEETLLIWDEPHKHPVNGHVVLWSSYSESRNAIISLPKEIDERALELRQRYLDFVHRLGVGQLGTRSIMEHLQIRKGLSYWWMTLPAQKDVYASSPYIYDVLKLFLLEDILKQRLPGKLQLVSSNRLLAEVLRKWCAAVSCKFTWAPPIRIPGETPKKFHRHLPMILRGFLAFLSFVAERWTVRPLSTAAPRPTDVTVFDIFTHFDASQAAQGTFKSGYWTKLATHFDAAGIKTQWLHWFYAHRTVPRMRDARNLVRCLTRASPSRHELIDFPLSLAVIRRVIRDYIHINRARRAMGPVDELFRPQNSHLDLWPLFREDWFNSFTGPRAILSLFHLNLIEASIDKLPRQKLGLFIQENQPWEMALTHAWKTRGHGPIVGVAHTTVPFWDLRYVFAAETLRTVAPLPDIIALNGPDALTKMLAAGYPPNLCVELEALRYLSLVSATDRRDRTPTGNAPSSPKKIRLLILGDLLPQYTESQLTYLENCPPIHGMTLDLVFRPHPACTDLPSRLTALGCVLAQGSLSEELQVCDAVFVGSATSAAADAYQIGVPIISLNDGDKINFSPLYGLPGVAFVHSAQDLAQALSSLSMDTSCWPRLFTIDGEIPRWKRLVNDALQGRAQEVIHTAPRSAG